MRATLLVVGLLSTVAVFGQTSSDAPCDPTTTAKPCTLGETVTHFRSADLATMVKADVTNTNKPTTPPDAFAARVHNSYEDYLNLLSFAINDVKESSDGKALVIRFNPLREGTHLFGATLTATKPGVSAAVSAALPDANRDTIVAALNQKLRDTDDLTWAGSYSYATADCRLVSMTKPCWGREPDAYREVLSLVVLANAPSTNLLDLAERIAALMPNKPESLFKLTVPAENREKVNALVQQLVAEEKAGAARSATFYKQSHLDLLPTLIDNQPQISGTYTYHTPGRVAGPIDRALSVEIHFGDTNVNSIRKACATDANVADCFQRQLVSLAQSGLNPNKFVFTATRTWAGGFHLSSADDAAITTPIALDKTSDWHVKAQAGRDLQQQGSTKAMRADLSFEGTRTEKGSIRNTNRWVGIATLSIPLGDTVTLPISLTWANKAEFLGDTNDRFGAHFGISYRLPSLAGSK